MALNLSRNVVGMEGGLALFASPRGIAQQRKA